MYVLNKASTADQLSDPVSITAYVGSLSKAHETILHPGLQKYLFTLKHQLDDYKYYQEENKIKLDIKNYIQGILYEAGLIYVQNNLLELDKNFTRVKCDKFLSAEEDVLEQLWLMTKDEPTKVVQVIALIEANGYEKRIVSSPGYGKFELTNIRIGHQHKELCKFI
ncbi:hypothetical protein LC605_11645 [Nostoc sp. CHAB 5836]|uniref:hypothetical protein n=1 Tax=Nostoc sp. CHAB 5836 TaxID=2780404 RepID=UPI001E60F98C|nr:hypothetical protein [Nostoc sp. CHAB 5836]MCC5615712.1 hypothetical protein [Nostoc sp. CHAB 5836]